MCPTASRSRLPFGRPASRRLRRGVYKPTQISLLAATFPFSRLATKFDTLLRACAHPDLYRRNAFRTLGLDAPAETRAITRRADELHVSLELGGDPETWAFAPSPAPDRDGLRAAARALQEPMQRLLDEFFWFWPMAYPESGYDEAQAHLRRCDTAAATALWTEAAGRGDPAGWHNLAVYQHLLALEWEHAADDDRATANQVWADASDYWRHVQTDDDLWRLVAARVAAMNDPQLPEGAATQLREALPEVLGRIHAENVVRCVAAHDDEAARLQVRLARNHLPPERVAAVFEAAAQPAVGRLETLTAQARRQAGTLDPIRALLTAAAPDLALLAAFGGPDGAAHLHEDQARLLADTVLDGLVTYQRATGDDLSCLPLLFLLLDLATMPELVRRVEQAFGVMVDNALATARIAAGERPPPEHVLTLELITASVMPGLASLPEFARSRTAVEATNARLAGWLKTVAEDAVQLSPAHAGWALRTLGLALALPMDAANAEALVRIRDAWLTPPPTPLVKTLELVAGATRLRIDAHGVVLNGVLVGVDELTGVRHAWTGFSHAQPTALGWCSAAEAFELPDDFFAQLPDPDGDGAPMRNVLAALHGFLVPALVARMLAALKDGATIELGAATLTADCVAWPGQETLTPLAGLLLAYRSDFVILASADQPDLTVELDPRSSWNVVLLPHFVAALTPRLP